MSSPDAQTVRDTPSREDGFVFAANDADLTDGGGLTVEVAGREYALFRVNGEVRCIDSACPHEGASLADGEVRDGVVVCPWHSWEFDVCTGCSLDPPGNDVASYATLVEDGRIFIRLAETAKSSRPAVGGKSGILAQLRAGGGATKRSQPVEAVLTVLDVIQETPDVRTFRLDNSDGAIPFDLPGKFAKVCVPTDDGDVWRSFTMSSSPHDARQLDLTIKLNPDGQVSRYLFEKIEPGDAIRLKGTQGGFFFDPEKHTEPLVMISAGSGITPVMSIVRMLSASGSDRPCTFLYGARTEADIIFRDECERLARDHEWFRYVVTLSQPGDAWAGECGRILPECLPSLIEHPSACRYFLCGPNEFMQTLREALCELGVPTERIHTEQFHATKTPQAVTTGLVPVGR